MEGCIIVFYGIPYEIYLELRQDLQEQFAAKGLDGPIFFTCLPADYVSIDIVWLEPPTKKERVLSVVEDIVLTES